jgi:hypothetical protein
MYGLQTQLSFSVVEMQIQNSSYFHRSLWIYHLLSIALISISVLYSVFNTEMRNGRAGVDLIKLFCVNLPTLFCKRNLSIAMQQKLLSFMKWPGFKKVWVNLQKQNFYEIDPRFLSGKRGVPKRKKAFLLLSCLKSAFILQPL